MKCFTYTVTNPVGIHARPAGLLVKAAKALDSAVTVECGGKSASVNKLMALMALGIKAGDTVNIMVEGGDEEAGLQVMKQFFQTYL